MALGSDLFPPCLPSLPLEPAGRPGSPRPPRPLPSPAQPWRGGFRPCPRLPGISGGARGLAWPPAPEVGLPAEGPGANQRSYLRSPAGARTSQDQFTFFGLGSLEPKQGGGRGPQIHRSRRQGLGHPTWGLHGPPGVETCPRLRPGNACALSTRGGGEAHRPPGSRAQPCAWPPPVCSLCLPPPDKALRRAPHLALCPPDRDSARHPAAV